MSEHDARGIEQLADPATWHGEAPALGAFSAIVTITGQVSGQAFSWGPAAATFAPSGSEARRSLSGVGPFVIGSGPPPPLPPTITSISPNPVVSGGTITVQGTGFDASTKVLWGTSQLTVASRSATALLATAPTVLTGAAATLVVTNGAGQVTGPVLAVTPKVGPPPPPGVIDVRTRGVKGDGSTIDKTALNNLISTAPAGATLFFGAGTYLIDDALKIFRPDIHFLGEGDTSILKSVQGSYHFQIGSGQPYTGISFRKLQLYGTPGQYMSDGTSRGGILNFGSKGTVFEDLLFTGCAEPILAAGVPGTTAGAIINRCKLAGWGRMGIFCNGGEQITNCQLIQDDPNLFGERSSHGFYIHGGASHVLVADTEIANVRKYALQVYSESEPSVTDDIQLLRLKISSCANGVILAHGNPLAGVLTNCLIEGCTITDTYGGSGIAVKNGNGVIIRNNRIDGNTGALNGHSGSGAYLGVWAPYEVGFSLSDVLLENNVIKNCDRGIWVLDSNSGKFTNCIIRNNQVSGCRKNYDITGAGVTVS